ncbi:Metallo-dependent phosphatase-like protein [Sporodiniella umbellata]|nr:Metallo-dependent phosphatase-like protein [Sporodiniella umbellata]
MIAAITFAAIAVIVIVIVVPVVEVKKKREAENSFEANNSSSYPISPYAHLTQIVTRNDSEIQSKKRIFVTGDLHGCLSEFNQLLTKINYNPAKDQMVLAGDLTSKGPDSLGVLRRAKELGILCVRGNHDDKLIRFKTFENERGIQVMDGKGTMPEGDVPDPLKFNNYHEPLAVNMTQGDYDYLLSCPVILHLPFLNNTVVVHGGLDPNIRMLKDQIPYLIMTMRDIDKKGRPTATSGKGTQWGIEWNEYQRSLSTNNTLIYYGHDAGRGLNLQNYTFGLDTGCVYGRHLTTINILNHQLYQINCTTDYTTDQDDDD